MDFNGIMGIFIAGCGLYCIYACYMMKKTGVINKTILMSKDMENQQCKDTKAYISEATPKVMALGIGAIASGGADLIDMYVIPLGNGVLVVMALFFAVLVWAGLSLAKLRKKYY